MNTPPPGWNEKAKSAVSTHFWLIISLIGNFFLLIFLYTAATPLGIPTVPPSSVDREPVIKTNLLVRHENFTWEQIESTNYETFIKNLRAVGCPEQTIRDLVVAEVNRIYLHRRLEEVNYPNFQWWRSEPDPAVVRAATAKLAALENERQTMLTTLLGPGWDAQSNEAIAADGGISLTGPILGALTPAVKDMVYAIIAKSELKIAAYREAQREQNKPLDAMEMVRLREEPLHFIASVLSPAQYQEYLLRYAPSAQQLRQQMRFISLSQSQFRELFTALNPIEGQPVYYYSGGDPGLMAQQQQLQNQSDALIKAILGDAVYGTYQLTQDPLYRSSKATVEQLGMPETSAASVYEINRATQSELERIRQDPNLSNDEKVEAVAQTQMDQQQSLEEIMGPDIFQKWLETHTNLQ